MCVKGNETKRNGYFVTSDTAVAQVLVEELSIAYPKYIRRVVHGTWSSLSPRAHPNVCPTVFRENLIHPEPYGAGEQGVSPEQNEDGKVIV